MRILRWLLAAGFDGRDARKIRGEPVFREGFNAHFDETDKGAPEARSLPAATVDDHADARDLSAVRPDDVDRLLHAAAACDHVFGYDKSLVRPDLKTAPQYEAASFFLHENVAFPERAPDFLADNNPAEGRGNDGVAFEGAQLVGEPSANISGNLGMLKQQRALEELTTVQTRPQNEMTVEQRPSLPEERKQILAHIVFPVAQASRL